MGSQRPHTAQPPPAIDLPSTSSPPPPGHLSGESWRPGAVNRGADSEYPQQYCLEIIFRMDVQGAGGQLARQDGQGGAVQLV